MNARTKRVPREPTREMLDGATRQPTMRLACSAIWQAMWDAAPDADAGRVMTELERNAALAADAGRVAELERFAEYPQDRLLAELERRIERALALGGDTVWSVGGPETLLKVRAILRGDPDV